MKNLIKTISSEKIILLVTLFISFFSHFYNMFGFPYYENDEGTYMSQAWSLLKLRALAPYTYWYDHSPFGWIVIAIWTVVTGGFFTFGLAVNSGRVFMLLLHIASSFFLFGIAKRITNRLGAGVISVLIFSLSPLGIYFQRRVLLDNIMIFFILASLWFLLRQRLKLRDIILSSVLFSFAVLSKENAIFFLPGFIYILWRLPHKSNKLFGVTQWFVISFSIISMYFLYAFYKSEFFFPATQDPKVSLLKTLSDQLQRGSSYAFWDSRSDIYRSFGSWIGKDPFTVIVGSVSFIALLVVSLFRKIYRVPVLFTLMFWTFLLRGKLVIDFYVIPLIPLLSLCSGLLMDFIISTISGSKRWVYAALTSFVVLVFAALLLMNDNGQFTRNETEPQTEILNWAYTHVPKDASVIIDDYALVDLREHGYNNADWFWKYWLDPAVANKVDKDWKRVDYVFLTHEMLSQTGLRLSYEPYIKYLLPNSKELARFGPMSEETFLNIDQFKSTNGDWASIFKRNPLDTITLSTSWRYYKNHFIHSYGQVIDPSNNQTTSEGQSYGMLRAVLLDDRETFDGIWSWTKDHLQWRNEDKLISWLWKDNKIIDSSPASDADQDIALALLFAYKRWGDEAYLQSATNIISDIWRQEVVRVGNRYILTFGVNSSRGDGYLVNPSYFSPASYRIFAEVDPKNPWDQLANDSYFFLNSLSASKPYGAKTLLPPNWVIVNKNGTFSSATQYTESSPNLYGYDAFRVYWRIALDVQWFSIGEGSDYLQKISPFFLSEWNKKHKIAATYSIDGQEVASVEDISTAAGPLSVFTITNKNMAGILYSTIYEKSFDYEKGSWANSEKYYDQNWAWFATALYTNNLVNYWVSK